MASGPISSWQKMWKQWKQWQTLFSWAPKSLQMVTAAMKLKGACSLEEKLWQIKPRETVLQVAASPCWYSVPKAAWPQDSRTVWDHCWSHNIPSIGVPDLSYGVNIARVTESVTVTWRRPHNEWKDHRANFCPARTCVLVPASTLTWRVTWVKLLKVSMLWSQRLWLQRSLPLTQGPTLYDNFFLDRKSVV